MPGSLTRTPSLIPILGTPLGRLGGNSRKRARFGVPPSLYIGMKRLALLVVLAGCAPAPAQTPASAYPRAMILPQPEDQLSFQVDGREWLRYHAGDREPKPYFYPVMGPSGSPVTRLTHPH